jgi:hypothetical protein
METKILLKIGGRLAQRKRRKVIKFDDVPSLCQGIKGDEYLLATVALLEQPGVSVWLEVSVWYDVEDGEFRSKAKHEVPGSSWAPSSVIIGEHCIAEIHRRYHEFEVQNLFKRVSRLPEINRPCM